MPLTGLITATMAVIIFLAASFTTVNAQQQQQQLTGQSSAIENRTAATQSTNDNIRLQVPKGWIIQDVNNTGFCIGSRDITGIWNIGTTLSR